MSRPWYIVELGIGGNKRKKLSGGIEPRTSFNAAQDSNHVTTEAITMGSYKRKQT